MKSDTQARILDFIRSTIITKGYAPTVREICAAVHISSTSTVHSHLDRLEQRGFIKRDKSRPRGIELVAKSLGSNKIAPVINDIDVSKSIFDPSNVIEYISTPSELTKSDEIIAYYVKDDKLKVDGIRKGDCLIIEVGAPPVGGYYALKTDDGEIVIIRSSQILDLARERFVSVEYSGRNLSALGAVSGLIRDLKI